MINQWIEQNWALVESIAKRVLKERWREGVSSFYVHLVEKEQVTQPTPAQVYWYMKNLSRPQSELNYIPITLRGDVLDVDYGDDNEVKKQDMMLDLKDERLVDFLMNNTNNDKWVKIYGVIYGNKIKLDLFETILFDYIFHQGLSIRKIAAITDMSVSYTYQLRKKLLTKISSAIQN